MRRPLLGALSGAAAALILLFGFSAWLFSRNMGQARHKSEERMTGLAVYIAEHLKEDIFSFPFEFQPSLFPQSYAEQQGEWLGRLTRATGLERAVITDSAGLVYASSQNLIGSGEEIGPYLVDKSLFALAAREDRALFTPLSEIDGVHFQSLYYPFTLRDKRHVVVLESDQNFIAYVEQFRNYLWFASLFLLALFALLAAGLFFLERQFQAALAVSRRNEHLAFLGRTSAELAHELKNPLAIMKASVDVLRNRLDPRREHAAFGYLSEEVMRLSRMIGNILGFSRDRPLEAEPFRPLAALGEARETQRLDFPGVEWILEVPGDLTLLGDRDAFRQLAENLGRNASGAMGGKGSVTVTWEARGRGGALRFEDSGPGLPKAIRGRLFEPFVSGSKTGTGLGLAIVKNLCERAGWTIALVSDAGADGKPTCFEVGIPGNRMAPPAKAAEGASAKDGTGTPRDRAKEA
ncbi:MAG TPA: HAMP domain-containing sensor histidine kinase [Fibrobacteria bacterium]|nr:HAMP domain-containing sensor histidine kinase [Fibrobacteria bacterium]